MPFLFTFSVVLTLGVGFHAYLEYKDDLAGYLARRFSRLAPSWLSPVFTSLAVVNILGPWYLGIFLPEHRPLLWSWTAAAILTDILGTHTIPSRLSGETAPATETKWIYLGLFALSGWFAYVAGGGSLHVSGLGLGVASFAALWPLLVVLWLFGVLRRPQLAI